MVDLVEPKHEAPRERRVWPRWAVDRLCKLYDPQSCKYHSGQTRDLSAGGALVEIERPLLLLPPCEVYIGIAQTRRHALLRTDEMVRARIVRALCTPEGKTLLALHWREDAVQEPLYKAA